MSTGSQIMMLEEKFLTQIGGGVNPNFNYADPSLYMQKPVSANLLIAPNGVYVGGVDVMVTPQVGLGTSFVITPNGNAGMIAAEYHW